MVLNKAELELLSEIASRADGRFLSLPLYDVIHAITFHGCAIVKVENELEAMLELRNGPAD